MRCIGQGTVVEMFSRLFYLGNMFFRQRGRLNEGGFVFVSAIREV